MSEITPLGRPTTTPSLGGADPRTAKIAPEGRSDTPRPDTVSLSEEGLSKSREQGQSAIRHDLVAGIRAQIENGSYETPDKLSAAIDKMLEEL